MLKLENCTRATDCQTFERAKSAFGQLLGRKDLGFFRLPERDDLWSAAGTRAAQIREHYSHLGVLGIGGSSLGARALIEAVDRHQNANKITFFDNVDPVHFADKLARVKKDTHWLIVSKSGGTVETLMQADLVAQSMVSRNHKLAQHATVVSELRDNPLSLWARQNEVPVLEIPEDVGGRFSVLTAAGLVPAAFLGMDLQKLKLGAQWALQQRDLVSELASQSLQSFAHEEWITLFWSYCDTLRWWGGWVQQLWAESLGKKYSLDDKLAPRVSTPIPCIGTCDQHSILQQVADGFKDKFVWFLRVDQSEKAGAALKSSQFGQSQKILIGKTMGALFAAEAEATRRALQERKIHSLTLRLPQLSETEVGALLLTLELVVGTIGQALNINAFDQPGVERGKQLARQILENSVG